MSKQMQEEDNSPGPLYTLGGEERLMPSASYRCHCVSVECSSSSCSTDSEPMLIDDTSFCALHHQKQGIDRLRKPVQKDRKRRHALDRKKGQKYLKPGALAQLRDAHKSSTRSSCTMIGRKRVVSIDGSENERVNANLQLAIEGDRPAAVLSPYRSSRSPIMFRPSCPQRKKLIGPRTPMTPAREPVASRNVSVNERPAEETVAESYMESLPLELLIRIVCSMSHDQLKPLFHVCKRLRQAVVIARQWHFDFRTPDRDHQEALGMVTPKPIHTNDLDAGAALLAIQPATPRAPRHAPKPVQVRIPLAEMRQVAASLFHVHHTNLTNVAPLKVGPSHRVLFYEEDALCRAVAQNTL